MKETFRQYQDYLISITKREICKDLAEKTFTGEKIKGWKKKYESSEEYKQLVEDVCAKSRKIKNINNLDETSKQYKFFINNEEAILHLLKNNIEITNLTIENYIVDKAVQEISFYNFISNYENYKNKIIERLNKYFTCNKISYYEDYYEDTDDEYSYYSHGYYNNYPKRRRVDLSVETIENFIELYDICAFSYNLLIGCSYCASYFKKYYKDAVKKLTPKYLTNYRAINNFEHRIWQRFENELNYHETLINEINKIFTTFAVLNLLKVNPNYVKQYDEIYSRAIALTTLQEDILNSIPDNYADLFPETRKMHRHFILHTGPTNSGKTYGAIEKLKQAKTGVYLAPLRLLAYEQFDSLNKQAICCSLLTGEESIEVPNSTHIASTIEMLDITKAYDIGVIDEGQMLSDKDRGGSWTTAIMALKANEIHICASKDAENILIKLIQDCGDTYEVIHTERQVPLIYDDKFNKFPKDVQEGDALIVFSRKDVHAVASVLHENNVECSMIYGALPYDVRHKEAEKFSTGKTKVVVATDAIGMGLNMPIKRVVFLKTSKYDGTFYRELLDTEIQQIAGRAGRYGIFDIGYYTKLKDAQNNINIKKRYEHIIPSITSATISMPKSLIDLDVSLSKIIEKWRGTTSKSGYVKANIDEELKLCRLIENMANGKKHILYDLITIPFSSKEDDLTDIWFTLATDILKNKDLDYKKYTKFLPVVDEKTSLRKLESDYRVCDLLYYFNYKFFKQETIAQELYNLKKYISELTIKKLDKGVTEKRTCKRCGGKLPWNHMYNICEECYYLGRYNYF